MKRKSPKPSNTLPSPLQEFVFGNPESDKRAERMARSDKARQHRAEVRELNQRKAARPTKG